MTSQERRELAFRIGGVALCTMAVAQAPLAIRMLGSVIRAAHGDTGILAVLLVARATVLMPAFGMWLLFFPRAACRVLLGSRAGGDYPRAEDTVQIGTALLAICFLSAVGSFVLLGFVEFDVLASVLSIVAIAVTIALYLLGRWGRPRALIARRMDTGRGAPSWSLDLVAMGIGMIGLYRCALSPYQVAGSAVGLVRSAGESYGADYPIRLVHLTSLVQSTCGGVLAVALVLWSGRLAGWLVRGRRPDEEPAGPTLEARPGTWFEVSLLVAVAYLFSRYLVHLVPSHLFLWAGTVALRAFVHLLVLPAAVAIAVFYVAALLAPKLARRLYADEPGPAKRETEPARLIFEVGLAVLAVNFMLMYLSAGAGDILTRLSVSEKWAILRGHPASLVAGIASIGLLCLRSDIAALALRGDVEGGVLTRPRRAAALYPWLVLLGVWFLFIDVKLALGWSAASAFGVGFPFCPPVLAFRGPLLIFAARWLSEKLSFGPLIPRIWRRPRDPSTY